MANELAFSVEDDYVWKSIISVKTAYKTLSDRFGFNIREILENHALPESIYNNYIIRKPITRGELSNKVYRDISPNFFWN
jgi:hypothetical protein